MRYILLAALMLWASYAKAENEVVQPSISEDVISQEGPPAQANGQVLSLDHGERAPWDGMLIEQRDLVRWRLEIDNLQFRRDRDVALEHDKCDVQVSYQLRLTDLERERGQMKSVLLQERIDSLANDVVEARKDVIRAAERGFFDEPMTWFVGGILISGTLVGIVAFSLR